MLHSFINCHAGDNLLYAHLWFQCKTWVSAVLAAHSIAVYHYSLLWESSLSKFQQVLLYTVQFVLLIMLTATSPGFVKSLLQGCAYLCCNIMMVMTHNWWTSNQKAYFPSLLIIHIQTHEICHGYWVIGLAFTLHPCKYHNCDCYHNCNMLLMLENRDMSNSHNHSGLLAWLYF